MKSCYEDDIKKKGNKQNESEEKRKYLAARLC